MAERPAASTKPVAQRLLLKAGSRALVLDAPPDYLDHFLTEVKVAVTQVAIDDVWSALRAKVVA